MRTPTVHLNGSSGKVLFEQVWNAGEAVRQALEVLEVAGPNARDYYPQGPGAFSEAIVEHRKRLQALIDVLVELTVISEAIQDQNG